MADNESWAKIDEELGSIEGGDRDAKPVRSDTVGRSDGNVQQPTGWANPTNRHPSDLDSPEFGLPDEVLAQRIARALDGEGIDHQSAMESLRREARIAHAKELVERFGALNVAEYLLKSEERIKELLRENAALRSELLRPWQ